MARTAREKSASGVYRVTLNAAYGVFTKEENRELFKTAAENRLGGGLLDLSFCGTAVNMRVRESENGISADLKPLITSFARAYNRIEGRTGKVFADRFKSVPDEGETQKRPAPKDTSAPKPNPKPKAARPPRISGNGRDLPPWLL